MRFTSVRTVLGLGKVARDRETGDFNEGSLARALNTPAINGRVVHTWEEVLSEYFTIRAAQSLHPCLLPTLVLKVPVCPRLYSVLICITYGI